MQPLNSGGIIFFHILAIFAIWGYKDKNCILIHNVIIMIFISFLEAILINVITILMMPAKVATPSLLKKKEFCNKYYDVTISVYEVIKNF